MSQNVSFMDIKMGIYSVIKHHYSQTCIKRSPKGRTKTGCFKQVSYNTGSFALHFGTRDLENVAA